MKIADAIFANQVQELIHSFNEMDYNRVELLLSECEHNKYFYIEGFLELLKNTFEDFKKAGDTELISHSGKCNNCIKGCKGITFVGNLTGNYMDLIIEEENGKVNDIYDCQYLINDYNDFTKKERKFIFEPRGENESFPF